MTRGLVGWITLLCAAAVSTPCTAQDDARLVEALAMAREGHSDSARSVLDHLLRATPPTDSLYAEVLYTAGSIAGTAQEMQRFYQRVSIEYAWSPWADDALLRLAQIDYAAHDREAAVRNLEAIRQDHPGSPLLPVAALWAARAYFDLGNTPAACQWLATGLDGVGADVELRNRLQYYRSRCRADSTDSVSPSPKVPSGQAYWVQALAARTEAAATAAKDRLEPLGYAVRVVPENGWLKVRVGAFADRAAAERAAARVQREFGGNPFIVQHP